MTDQINLPKNLSPCARDLIKSILVNDPNIRIELADIKRHKFFKNINWQEVKDKKCPAPLTYINDIQNSPNKNFLTNSDKKRGTNGKTRVLGDYHMRKINEAFANF